VKYITKIISDPMNQITPKSMQLAIRYRLLVMRHTVWQDFELMQGFSAIFAVRERL